MLHPPPAYKLKVETPDEHHALVLLCELCADGSISTTDLLARHIRFKVLEKEAKGKNTYSISLTAHDALQLSTMLYMVENRLKYKLASYNRALYLRWAGSIHQATQNYYVFKINA